MACRPCNIIKGKRVYKNYEDAKKYVLARREEMRMAWEAEHATPPLRHTRLEQLQVDEIRRHVGSPILARFVQYIAALTVNLSSSTLVLLTRWNGPLFLRVPSHYGSCGIVHLTFPMHQEV